MIYQKSVKTDEVLSLNNLGDFIFESLMVVIQIDPEGSPVLCYGKQKSVRLKSTVGFLSRNRAGWSQGGIEQVYVYIYLHNMCATTWKDFSTSYGFIEKLLKELPP